MSLQWVCKLSLLDFLKETTKSYNKIICDLLLEDFLSSLAFKLPSQILVGEIIKRINLEKIKIRIFADWC